MNLTINNELLDANVLAVNLMKADSGSGVREVDLYQITPGRTAHIGMITTLDTKIKETTPTKSLV